MLWSTSYIGCVSTLRITLLLFQPTAGTGFLPRDNIVGEAIVHRACEPAAPGVNESSVRFLEKPVTRNPC